MGMGGGLPMTAEKKPPLRWLTIRQAADLLGIDASSVRERLIRQTLYGRRVWNNATPRWEVSFRAVLAEMDRKNRR